MAVHGKKLSDTFFLPVVYEVVDVKRPKLVSLRSVNELNFCCLNSVGIGFQPFICDRMNCRAENNLSHRNRQRCMNVRNV